MNEFLIGFTKSKTVWVNIASIALEITGALAGVVPPGTALIAINILNIGLRAITKESISEKGEK